jgi:hypothetical protein
MTGLQFLIWGGGQDASFLRFYTSASETVLPLFILNGPACLAWQVIMNFQKMKLILNG